MRLSNPAIQQRVAAFTGAVDFLLLAGFQREAEGGENLEMPEDKVSEEAHAQDGCRQATDPQPGVLPGQAAMPCHAIMACHGIANALLMAGPCWAAV